MRTIIAKNNIKVESLVFVILIILIGLTFTNCESSNLLIRSKRKYYSEKNLFCIDSSRITIKQEVCYNNPKSIDEEVWYDLKIIIERNKLDNSSSLYRLDCDSINTDFYIFPKEGFRKSTYLITGNIDLFKLQNDLLEIKENIEIQNTETKRIYKFSGKRRIEKKQ